jgi:hypothetical protein
MLSLNEVSVSDQAQIEMLIEKIGDVLDGHDNAIVVPALISSLAICTLVAVPPYARNTALKFIFKSMREMVEQGTDSEKMRMQ